jgi:hypothetical protein
MTKRYSFFLHGGGVGMAIPSQRKHHPNSVTTTKKTIEDDSSNEDHAKQPMTTYYYNKQMDIGSAAIAFLAAATSLLKVTCHRIPPNMIRYWTDMKTTTTLTFTEPLLTFKMLLVLLLFIELNDIMAAEQSMLATPELVSLMNAYPKHDENNYVYPWAEALMMNLSEDNVEAWFPFWKCFETILLI